MSEENLKKYLIIVNHFISNDDDLEEIKKYIAHVLYDVDKNYKQEIKRLNNIINDLLDRQNEALRYIGNHLSLDSRYKHGNGDEELILVRKILNKHTKELKGSE